MGESQLLMDVLPAVVGAQPVELRLTVTGGSSSAAPTPAGAPLTLKLRAVGGKTFTVKTTTVSRRLL